MFLRYRPVPNVTVREANWLVIGVREKRPLAEVWEMPGVRTVALLTERLDQHRGRGQQQITVKQMQLFHVFCTQLRLHAAECFRHTRLQNR
jgi:hypothetical protein